MIELFIACLDVVPLVASPPTAYAWLGGDPAGDVLHWGIELGKNQRDWIVRSIFHEDYEEP